MGRFNNSHRSTSQTNSHLHSVSLDQSKKTSSLVDSQLNYSSALAPHEFIAPDYICFSHLRWDFVYQRPQHLMSRCARERRVFFVEEPVFSATEPRLNITRRDCGVYVVKPHLPCSLSDQEITHTLQALVIDDLILDHNITEYVLWYYTPMALSFSEHLEPLAIVYDCMDELSAFKNPPKGLKKREAELFKRADLVFTGGHSLYEAKRHQHLNIHPFPSSIDANHFRNARNSLDEPADQLPIPHPRLGFFGVIDERFDTDLLDGLAMKRPDWQFVIIGPIVKIEPEELPTRPNIHYTGPKSYQELPNYLSGWDVAMLPFARNDSTRYISPTKTPEYLAAGIPVISTSIQDVIRPYGKQGLVKIADSVDEFVDAATFLMSDKFDRAEWLRAVDEALLYNSWELTWSRMSSLIDSVLEFRYPEAEDSLSQVSSQRSSLKSIAVSPALGD